MHEYDGGCVGPHDNVLPTALERSNHRSPERRYKIMRGQDINRAVPVHLRLDDPASRETGLDEGVHDSLNYRQQAGTYKLNVAEVDAEIFHYGWVRPPRVMQNKIKAFSANHRGRESVAAMEAAHQFDRIFDYGNLSKYTCYEGTHPAVMQPWMANFDWKEQLRFTGPAQSQNPFKAKHDKTKYRVITWIEKKLLGGRRLGEFKNYILLKR